MSKRKKQKYEGIVYSTDESFSYDEEEHDTQGTLPNSQQNLKVFLDRRFRKGKVVTIVDNFVGAENDLNDLAKLLKQKCGVGGSVKEGQIIIQGEMREKVYDILVSREYKVKISGK
ncbi:MAG TPA: translation initiation factor [Sphingobacterium sp.]|nr:translation initiation factor [Sphingobacterium sp.]